MTDRRAAATFTRADVVRPEWVDYNGHMGDFAYAIAFSQTVTAFMDVIGIDRTYRDATSSTLYTLDMRIGYQRECHEGLALELTLHVLAADAKRMHLYLEMHDGDGNLLAWNEQVQLHVSRASGLPKAAAFPEDIAARIKEAAQKAPAIPPLAHIEKRIGLGK
ncbi:MULTISPECIES: thioesterase family protein [unclassified Aminobacter]|uniref:thioesterase family protein n=1 Tax=unclassified Aminobacter TaxID=2644704 RepID=UPI000464501C|nr:MULTISPECIES: thioesterase family protein [unclassified Aminobacter]TWG55183.1 acyl-CoA thioester hydrolase [Aminobacter sp. J44]TWH31241.1 acyl-CoA thioester hydrolase [Aminobacter sp. J15]